MTYGASLQKLPRWIRFVIVGVASNAAGFAVYLLLTWLGANPLWTMTALYAVGMVLSFSGNRTITFARLGPRAGAGVRFFLAYLLGYLVNAALLLALPVWLGWPHQWAQAVAIVIVAIGLYGLMRCWVFASPATPCHTS